MNAKHLTGQRLPILLATGLLSTGLLLSSCSDKGSTESAASDETVAATDTADSTSSSSTEITNTEAVADTAGSNEQPTVMPADDNMTQVINPANADQGQQSLLTNPSTQAGTPEDTVKKALDSLYYGDAKEAASYYQVDMANFPDELAKTQYAFQQTVESITITDTKYNSDKTRATISGELKLKGQQKRSPLTYELQKIDGNWKILG